MDFFREFSLNLLEYSILMVITFDIKPSDVLFLEKQIHSINMDYEEMYFFIIFFFFEEHNKHYFSSKYASVYPWHFTGESFICSV